MAADCLPDKTTRKNGAPMSAVTTRGLVKRFGATTVLNGIDLDVAPEECTVGDWDLARIRTLFTSLEFRTLYERLEEIAALATAFQPTAEFALESRAQGAAFLKAVTSAWPAASCRRCRSRATLPSRPM